MAAAPKDPGFGGIGALLDQVSVCGSYAATATPPAVSPPITYNVPFNATTPAKSRAVGSGAFVIQQSWQITVAVNVAKISRAPVSVSTAGTSHFCSLSGPRVPRACT